MTIIETPRITLRRWRESDLPAFIAMNADPEVMRHYPEPYTEARTRQFYGIILQEFAECGYGLYAAEEKSSGLFMGYVGFHRASMAVEFCPCVEIGWRLAREHWGRGYATEAARACLAHGFSQLGFTEVYSFTTLANLPSQRVMQKIGMAEHCRFDHPGIAEGHPQRPHVCYLGIRK